VPALTPGASHQIITDNPIFPSVAIVIFSICMVIIILFRKEIRKMTFRREAYHTIDEPTPFTEMANIERSASIDDEMTDTDGYEFPEDSAGAADSENSAIEKTDVNDLI
jgi:hypothetical protein